MGKEFILIFLTRKNQPVASGGGGIRPTTLVRHAAKVGVSPRRCCTERNSRRRSSLQASPCRFRPHPVPKNGLEVAYKLTVQKTLLPNIADPLILVVTMESVTHWSIMQQWPVFPPGYRRCCTESNSRRCCRRPLCRHSLHSVLKIGSKVAFRLSVPKFVPYKRCRPPPPFHNLEEAIASDGERMRGGISWRIAGIGGVEAKAYAAVIGAVDKSAAALGKLAQQFACQLCFCQR